MAQRKRKHSFSILLSDEEYALWLKKHNASGLNKTDYFVRLLKGSVIKVFNFDKDLNALYKELRKIGVNLNQIAALANSGRLPEAEREIHNMLSYYNSVMGSLKAFLDKPLINAEISEGGGDSP